MTEIISTDLAQRLKAAGLEWIPDLHDFFMIPDTHFQERCFVVSDVQANLELYRGTPMVTFHGALEWALDHIMQQEVVWLPTETQLREKLAIHAEQFCLKNDPAGYLCLIEFGGNTFSFTAKSGIDAYAEALLYVLLSQNLVNGEN